MILVQSPPPPSPIPRTRSLVCHSVRCAVVIRARALLQTPGDHQWQRATPFWTAQQQAVARQVSPPIVPKSGGYCTARVRNGYRFRRLPLSFHLSSSFETVRPFPNYCTPCATSTAPPAQRKRKRKRKPIAAAAMPSSRLTGFHRLCTAAGINLAPDNFSQPPPHSIWRR